MAEDLLDNTRRAYDNRIGFGEQPVLLMIDFVEAYFDPSCELSFTFLEPVAPIRRHPAICCILVHDVVQEQSGGRNFIE